MTPAELERFSAKALQPRQPEPSGDVRLNSPTDVADIIASVRKMPRQKPGNSVQSVGTPPEFLRAVEQRFGELRWDLAADETNHVTPEWSGPGSPSQPDSLAGVWRELPPGLLWLNPPYGNIAPWAEKCSRWRFGDYGNSRQQRIAFLVPASVGANWFAEHVDGKAFVLFLRPRLTFVGHKDPYPKDLMLAVYGEGPGYECWRWSAARRSTPQRGA